MDLHVGNTNDSITLNDDFRHKVMPVTIVVGVEILIGLIGNIVVLWTYGFRYETSTYRSFIVYLGMIDLFSCLVTMPGGIYSEMFWFDYGYSALCKARSFFNIFVVVADVFAILTIAIDRYKRICQPHTEQISSSLAAYICVCITITAGAYAAPGALVDGLMHERILYNGQNVTATLCATSDQYKNTNAHLIYIIVLVATIGLSLISMMMIFSATARKLSRSRPASSNDDEYSRILNTRPDLLQPGIRRQTTILFTISIVFALTIGTYLTLDIYRLHHFGDFTMKEFVYFLFFWRLYFINHAINPFIYGWLDPGFRQLMRRAIYNKG